MMLFSIYQININARYYATHALYDMKNLFKIETINEMKVIEKKEQI